MKTKPAIQPEEYEKLVSRATIVAICTASLLIAIKLFVVVISNSISLYASLMDSVFDLACSAINLFFIRKALKPADDDHQFGHGKLEYFGILGQSIFLGTLSTSLVFSAFSRLKTDVQIQYSGPSLVILAIVLVATFCLVVYQGKVIRKTDSEMIKVDQAHYKLDLLMNSSVAVAIIFNSYGYTKVDPILAIIIGVYMIISVIGMLKSAYDGLTDKVLPEEDLHLIQDIVCRHPDVINIHDLRTRQASTIKYIQFHLELDDNLSLKDTHNICDELETTLMTAFPGAMIHIHPEPSSVAKLEREGTYQARVNQDLLDCLHTDFAK